MGTHLRSTDDGLTTECDCELGVDHLADLEPDALEDGLIEPNDRFTGMADQAAEEVVE